MMGRTHMCKLYKKRLEWTGGDTESHRSALFSHVPLGHPKPSLLTEQALGFSSQNGWLLF